MKIEHNVKIPIGRAEAEDIEALYDFYNDDDSENMCITYDDPKQAGNRRSTLQITADRAGMKLFFKRIADKVYIAKAGVGIK